MRLKTFARLMVAVGAATIMTPASAGEFQPISMETVTAAVQAKRPMVFHVRTANGPLCVAQHEVLKKLMAEPEFADYLVLEVDFFENERAVKMLGADLPGTILLGRAGSEIARMQGETDEASIRALLMRAKSDAE